MKKLLLPIVVMPLPPLCAAIQSDKFPEDIVVSYLQVGRLSSVFQVLGIRSDGAVAVKVASFADCRPSMYGDMGIEPGAGAYLGVWPDDAVRSDMGFRGNLTGTVNNRCWVCRHGIWKEDGHS